MSLTQWKRLIRYSNANNEIKFGEPVLEDDGADIHQLAKDGKLVVDVLQGDNPFSAVPTGQKDTVRVLLGPLTPVDVPYVRCVGLNYKSHILESGRELPKCPTLFTKPGTAVTDTWAPVPIPEVAQHQCDYEGELVIVIGKDAKNVTEEDALNYVAGYVSGNDVSARDWQREAHKAGPVPQWTFSKSFDKYAPLGPCIVSPAILGAADKQDLKTWVNGELRQTSNTSDLCFGVRALIAFFSQGQTLQAGSLIMTGTPGGVGLFMKPPSFLKHGDEVTVEISGIGKVVNRIEFERSTAA